MVPTRARTEPGSTIRRLLAESVNELIREGHRNLGRRGSSDKCRQQTRYGEDWAIPARILIEALDPKGRAIRQLADPNGLAPS
jgi:hypothetical protein